MQRRRFLTATAGVVGLAVGPPAWLWAQPPGHRPPTDFGLLQLSEAQWREVLAPERYAVLREEATEPAGSSPLVREKRAGTFICAGCNLSLFAASAMYDSGTGWPSFWQPISPEHIGTKRDFKAFWPRTEYHCARCGGHQGHVFDDGPPPTGKRYCNNGLALAFVPENESLPPLREAP